MSELYKALAIAQSQIEGASKDKLNPHFKSKYADLGSVWDACREALTSNGISVSQMARSFDGELRLVTRLNHASGEGIEDEGWPLMLDKQNMQGLGSAITYSRRYGLMAMVGIAPEDDDGNTAVGDGPGKKVAAKAKSPSPAAIAAAEKYADEIFQQASAVFDIAEFSALMDTNRTKLDALKKYPDIHAGLDVKLNELEATMTEKAA